MGDLQKQKAIYIDLMVERSILSDAAVLEKTRKSKQKALNIKQTLDTQARKKEHQTIKKDHQANMQQYKQKLAEGGEINQSFTLTKAQRIAWTIFKWWFFGGMLLAIIVPFFKE